MRTHLDPYDPSTLYADLQDSEPLSDALEARALARAHELGASFVEFWTAPYGADPRERMAGFVCTAAVAVRQAPPERPALEAGGVAGAP